MIEEIRDNATLDGSEGILAIIIRGDGPTSPKGLNFITDKRAELQVATIRHPSGYEIQNHYHPPRRKEVPEGPPHEVIIMRKGYLDVRIYNSQRERIADRTLGPDDILILLRGGHGFTASTDVEMVEVRQGPYLEKEDKVRF